MMNLPHAETFGEIPTQASQCDDIQSLLKMDTQDLVRPGDLDDFWKQMENSPASFDMDSKPLAFSTFVDHTNRNPELEDLSNSNYNFNVGMKGQDCKSTSWCYSSLNQKLYVKKKSSITVDVSYRNPLPGARLYVRLMMVCSAPQDVHRPISRCQHDITKDHAQGDHLKDHIVRCLNPQATYWGNASGINFKDRLAMVIQLDGAGEHLSTPVSLEFLCQNSCPTIERRATSLVFTLEDENGAILGRRSINVKVCSCPKRDMDKEEGKGTNGSGGKRKQDANNSAPTVGEEPPRKLTRQSSVNCGVRSTRSATVNQRDSPVPSTSAVTLDCIKKETPYAPLSRSSSNISNPAIENDSTAIVMNLRLPDIATAVALAEYAFMHISADMVRCGDEEKRTRLAQFLAHCRRVKRELEKRMRENTESVFVYDSE
uniref:p53 DNA-binding domain-containing protein n=1 Tax=Anopheles atroparvus TaxID=41427 RepID=A0AAG5CW96_ANOAO